MAALPRVVWAAMALAGLLLFWHVLTRFYSGQINAIDFTIYYDRPCFQTVQGRPLLVEVSDTPGLSYRSELGDHAYWGMLAVCSVYALHPSPLWLHALSVAAVVGGAFYVLRVLQRVGAGGVVASAGGLAFLLNDNTARTLNYGFHPEVLYSWFVPWMIDAGLRGARRSFLLAMLGCLLVKEDACLPILGVCVALALNRFRVMSRAERYLFLLLPPLMAFSSLVLYYGFVLPLLTGGTTPTYAHFWANYGETPLRALAGMCKNPRRVLRDTMTSGIFRVLKPHLFLPLIGWRWTLGIAPIVVLYAASANQQVREFGIYYASVLVPFLVIGSSAGALMVARLFFKQVGTAHACAGSAILLGSLLVGFGTHGYSLRPWKPAIAAVPAALARLADEPVVLVQSGLFPHAGYDERWKLLTPATLNDPRHAGVAVLLAPDVSAYPFSKLDLAGLLDRPSILPMPAGPDGGSAADPTLRGGTGGGPASAGRCGATRRIAGALIEGREWGRARSGLPGERATPGSKGRLGRDLAQPAGIGEQRLRRLGVEDLPARAVRLDEDEARGSGVRIDLGIDDAPRRPVRGAAVEGPRGQGHEARAVVLGGDDVPGAEAARVEAGQSPEDHGARVR